MKRVLAIILFVFTLLFSFSACGGPSKDEIDKVHNTFIGQTFTGSFSFISGPFNCYKDNFDYTVSIIDKTNCKVSYYQKITDTSRSEISQEKTHSNEDNNAQYTITADSNGFYFNWESKIIAGAVEPFKITIDKNKIKLTTMEYCSGVSLDLKN